MCKEKTTKYKYFGIEVEVPESIKYLSIGGSTGNILGHISTPSACNNEYHDSADLRIIKFDILCGQKNNWRESLTHVNNLEKVEECGKPADYIKIDLGGVHYTATHGEVTTSCGGSRMELGGVELVEEKECDPFANLPQCPLYNPYGISGYVPYAVLNENDFTYSKFHAFAQVIWLRDQWRDDACEMTHYVHRDGFSRRNQLVVGGTHGYPKTLSFDTEVKAQAFLDRFKDLIEKAGDLI